MLSFDIFRVIEFFPLMRYILFFFDQEYKFSQTPNWKCYQMCRLRCWSHDIELLNSVQI